jgi:hypothetical protein
LRPYCGPLARDRVAACWSLARDEVSMLDVM